ncbi:MAG: diguanylate cyclase [Cyanobacteria bacterium P01_F01_bin.150]
MTEQLVQDSTDACHSPTMGTILIVEDDLVNRKVLSNILCHQGFTVNVAIGGEDALMKLTQISVDLILLDVVMKGLDGFATCERIKRNPKTQDIPIIFITALTTPEDKVRGLDMGAVDYITKPFHPSEIVARVKLQLSLRATTQELVEMATQLEAELESHRQTTKQLEAEIESHKQAVRQLEKSNQALEKTNKFLHRLANLDGLTQIANRYCFDEALSEEWLRLARDNRPIGIVLCDVDHFKVYNDYYGHQAGDECLRKIAHAIFRSARRPADLVARYGGEEFVVLLPDTDQAGVQHVAATICHEIRTLQIAHNQSTSSDVVTISVGGCSLIPDAAASPNMLVDIADKALYQAKKQGRNQFALATSL